MSTFFAFLMGRLPSIILWMMGKLANISSEDWQYALRWVEDAENNPLFKDGTSRGKWVKQQVTAYLPHLVPFARDLLISLAIGYLNKLGTIKVTLPPEQDA